MELILTKKAYRSIVKECLSHPQAETGGILIGRIMDGFAIAPFAIGSGPKAKRSWARFSPDTNWQQRKLDKLSKKYRLNYLGSYHKHPGNLREPSRWDTQTAQEILSDPGWNISEAVFPIIIPNGEKIEIYPYYISRQRRELQPIPWEIVSRRDQRVRNIYGRRGIHLQLWRGILPLESPED